MITIVSGLPRSGTSLMMQMLAAGGVPTLSDGERRADVDNPRGYLEWERIKQLPKDPSCIAEAEGKAVKVISKLLLSLPAGHEYRVIFMQRPLPEVMASQDEMLRRRGNFDPDEDNSVVARAFQDHLSDVYAWLNGKPYVKVSRVQYHAVLREPKEAAEAQVGPGKIEKCSTWNILCLSYDTYNNVLKQRKSNERSDLRLEQNLHCYQGFPRRNPTRAAFEVATCDLKEIRRPANRLLFGRRKLKPDLALRRSLREHQFLDGVDEVLNRGVVSFQAAV